MAVKGRCAPRAPFRTLVGLSSSNALFRQQHRAKDHSPGAPQCPIRPCWPPGGTAFDVLETNVEMHYTILALPHTAFPATTALPEGLPGGRSRVRHAPLERERPCSLPQTLNLRRSLQTDADPAAAVPVTVAGRLAYSPASSTTSIAGGTNVKPSCCNIFPSL